MWPNMRLNERLLYGRLSVRMTMKLTMWPNWRLLNVGLNGRLGC